jgi:hypothetical protein
MFLQFSVFVTCYRHVAGSELGVFATYWICLFSGVCDTVHMTGDNEIGTAWKEAADR